MTLLDRHEIGICNRKPIRTPHRCTLTSTYEVPYVHSPYFICEPTKATLVARPSDTEHEHTEPELSVGSAQDLLEILPQRSPNIPRP